MRLTDYTQSRSICLPIHPSIHSPPFDPFFKHVPRDSWYLDNVDKLTPTEGGRQLTKTTNPLAWLNGISCSYTSDHSHRPMMIVTIVVDVNICTSRHSHLHTLPFIIIIININIAISSSVAVKIHHVSRGKGKFIAPHGEQTQPIILLLRMARVPCLSPTTTHVYMSHESNWGETSFG